MSGDTSCTDHIIAWKLLHSLNLDNVPAGVGESNTDNIILTSGPVSGFEHPTCFDVAPGNHVTISNDLPETHPVGPGE